MRIAILDDYQHAALASADWTRLEAEEITPFHYDEEPLPGDVRCGTPHGRY